jgi:hypothetical protein
VQTTNGPLLPLSGGGIKDSQLDRMGSADDTCFGFSPPPERGGWEGVDFC